MLEENLGLLEEAMKGMEISLLGSKNVTLADLEEEIQTEGSDALQQILDQFKELRDRKSKIETELEQLSGGQQDQPADSTTPANEIEPDSRESETFPVHFEQEEASNLQQERVDKDLEKEELKEVEEGKYSLSGKLLTLTQPHPLNQKEYAKEKDGEGNRPEEKSREKSEQRMDKVVHCEKRKRWVKKVCWLCAAATTGEGFDLHWCAGCRKAR